MVCTLIVVLMVRVKLLIAVLSQVKRLIKVKISTKLCIICIPFALISCNAGSNSTNTNFDTQVHPYPENFMLDAVSTPSINQLNMNITPWQDMVITKINVNYYKSSDCSGSTVSSYPMSGSMTWKQGSINPTGDLGNYGICSQYSNGANKGCDALYKDGVNKVVQSIQFQFTAAPSNAPDKTTVTNACMKNTIFGAYKDSNLTGTCTSDSCGFNATYNATLPGGTYFVPYYPKDCVTTSGIGKQCTCIQDPVTKNIWFADIGSTLGTWNDWANNGSKISAFNKSSQCGEALPGTWHLPSSPKPVNSNFLSLANPGGEWSSLYAATLVSTSGNFIDSGNGALNLGSYLNSNGFLNATKGFYGLFPATSRGNAYMLTMSVSGVNLFPTSSNAEAILVMSPPK